MVDKRPRRVHTKAPYKSDLLWRTPRAPKCLKRARTVAARVPERVPVEAEVPCDSDDDVFSTIMQPPYSLLFKDVWGGPSPGRRHSCVAPRRRR